MQWRGGEVGRRKERVWESIEANVHHSLQRTLNPRTVELVYQMISGLRWIIPDEICLFHNWSGLKSSSSKCCQLKSDCFFKHRFHIIHFPNSTGLFTKPTGRHHTKYRFSLDIAWCSSMFVNRNTLLQMVVFFSFNKYWCREFLMVYYTMSQQQRSLFSNISHWLKKWMAVPTLFYPRSLKLEMTMGEHVNKCMRKWRASDTKS